MRARLLLLGLLVGLMALLPAAVHAAVPAAGTVSPATPTSSWTGGPFLTSNPSGLCLGGRPVVRHLRTDDHTSCDRQLHGRDHDHPLFGR